LSHTPLFPNLDPNDPAVIDAIDELARCTGADPDTLEGRQVVELIQTAVKLMPEGRHGGELKLLNSALKELRYSYMIFAEYQSIPKVSIFGSARTPEDHPDYRATVRFARRMAELGWMIITGAGDGIMKAGHEGPGREASFGVAIRLPFETTANSIIAGDEKLINFRYFFTRKLVFVSQSNAVCLFPGGFGTQDEHFETLTLIQTGKSQMVPIVLMSGEENGAKEEDGYWHGWDRFVREQLLDRGAISEPDLHLYYLAKDEDDAADHITHFYRNFHSYRYVRRDFVIRLKHRFSEEQVGELNERFGDLIESGHMVQRNALELETEHLDLPRLVFHHTRKDWGRVRQMIDAMNDMDPPGDE